jgi:hypothetical protein
MAQRFDELSKIFATGLSRRQALRWIGGALGGGLVGSIVGIDQVMAAPSGCAVFCGKTAFSSGPAHASCLQACHQCGGDVNRICTGPTGSACCGPDQFCDFNSGTCITAGTCTTHSCGTQCNQGCGCVQTTEGNTACVQEICTGQLCNSSADCGAGSVCFTEGCCGPGNFCIPLCA